MSAQFSIVYWDSWGDQYAADWHGIKRRWELSERSRGSTWLPWEDRGDLDERAYREMLDAFGLDKYQVSLDQMVEMSPSQLAALGTNDPESYFGNVKASEME